MTKKLLSVLVLEMIGTGMVLYAGGQIATGGHWLLIMALSLGAGFVLRRSRDIVDAEIVRRTRAERHPLCGAAGSGHCLLLATDLDEEDAGT